MKKNLYKNSESKNVAKFVGTNLKVARLKYDKLTQEGVSNTIGIHPTQLAHFEAGRRVPSLIVFAKLCELYNVSPKDILDLKTPFSGITMLNNINKLTEENDIYTSSSAEEVNFAF